MIGIIQTFVAIALSMLSIIILCANWWIVIRSEIDPSYSASMILLVGGLAGAAALLICPSHDVHFYWWIPLLLDWGSGLGVLSAPIFYLRHRIRSRNE